MTETRPTGAIRALRGATLLACMVALTACGGSGLFNRGGDTVEAPNLVQFPNSQTTPDEFSILPNKPIEIPEDLAALPAPTPGAGNRVDPTPRGDAVAALGGDPSRVVARDGVFASADAALVNATSRYGVAGAIREDLAVADLQFRQANNGLFLERLFNVNVYFKAYQSQSLDQYAELERFRRAGIRTVSAPPERSE